MRFNDLAIYLMPLFALLACTNNTPANVRNSPTVTYVYECPGNFAFIARTQNNSVWLFLPTGTLHLPLTTSLSGEKYSKQNKLFGIRNNEAQLITESGEHYNCKNNRQKAIWEHAKLNGVGFRGTGNEPPWVIEISQNKLNFIQGYNQKQHTFTKLKISTNLNRHSLIYRANKADNVIKATLVSKPCNDTMSDNTFETTISIIFNKQHYNGCGKSLH